MYVTRETFAEVSLPGRETSAEVSRPRRLLSLPRVNRNVVGLGFTSLFTDISSEMVSSVLPMYLMLFLRLSPLQFGLVDGLYQGVGALVKIGFGFAADRLARHKEVAFLGYALSAVCKVGLLAVGSAWGLLSAVVIADRTGKGIRTAPRDALISLSTPASELGMAFGVHSALDTRRRDDRPAACVRAAGAHPECVRRGLRRPACASR